MRDPQVIDPSHQGYDFRLTGTGHGLKGEEESWQFFSFENEGRDLHWLSFYYLPQLIAIAPMRHTTNPIRTMRIRPMANRLRLFHQPFRARFLNRPNRFLIRCELKGRRVSAFLP